MKLFAQRLMTALLAATAALLIGCVAASQAGPPKVKAQKDRKEAPDFDLKDANGQSVKLSDYKGKVVLLNFWATWCGPCKIEIPWFADFEQRYRDKGFAVLGVAMDDEGWEVVKPYSEKAKVNYRLVIGNDHLAEMYGGVESLPTSFIIDKDGRIAKVHVGLVSKSDYENEIKELLGAAAGK
jgi:peroxiredoxin